MSRGRNGGAGGAKGARGATGAAPAAAGRGKGRWSARRKMTVVVELLRGAELEATSRKYGVRGLDRRDRLTRVGGSGTELAVEGLVDEGAQSGADVEAPLGAEALEPLTGFGRDADMKWNTVQHKDTH